MTLISFRKSTTIFSLLSIFSFSQAQAQYFGGTSASVGLRSVDNDSVMVIYPKGVYATANKVLNIIASEANKDGYSLGNKHRKLPIVLRPETMITNGYVGLGPYRSEFYLSPTISPFVLGSMDWASTLAV